MPRQRAVQMTMGPLPMPPLNLEEVRFWLDIMREHALFIKAGLPCNNTAFIDEAQAFYQEFNALYIRAEKAKDSKRFLDLVANAKTAVYSFHHFKLRLAHMVLTCKLGGFNFPLQLDHMAREAMYFYRLLEKMGGSGCALARAVATHEMAFWVRIMADHAHFIDHLLDPSERVLIAATRKCACDFDELFLQSRDFVSMLYGLQGYIPVYERFIMDVRTSVLELRDFKNTLHELIVDCKVASLIPAALAAHVQREAEHFLLILTMMQKGMLKAAATPIPDAGPAVLDGAGMLPLSEEIITQAEFVPGPEPEPFFTNEPPPEPFFGNGSPAGSTPFFDNTPPMPFFENERPQEPAADAPEPAEVKPEISEEDIDDDAPLPPVEEPKPAKSGKFKWSDKWPRPLGKRSEE